MVTRIPILAASMALTVSSASADATGRPDVVFIICDDLNDAIAGLGGVPHAATPNIDRLRARGVTFTNAAANSPICLPSRNSLLTGRHPRTLDHYRLSDNVEELPTLRDAVLLPELLRENGYATFGCGKVMHGGGRFTRTRADWDFWDKFSGGPGYGPFPYDPNGASPLQKLRIHPRQQALMDHPELPALGRKFRDPFWMFDNNEMKFAFEHGFAPLEDVPPGGWHWPDGTPFRFVSDADRDLLEDEKSAAFASGVIAQQRKKPAFLAVGFIRPHTPLYVPQRWFDMFPLDKIPLPVRKADELAEVATAHRDNRPYGRLRWEMLRPGGEKTYREWLQAYLASIAFMDDQLGVILDAIEASPQAANTLVIFTSDNGYHMGDKDNLFKDTLWESSARVPLIIAGPGIARDKTCDTPVSLVDLFPTIAKACGVKDLPDALDGHPLQPLLSDPDAGRWDGPPVAVTGVRGLTGTHFSARSKTHRYILCEDGSEELYDHTKDPSEHHNLADDPGSASAKAFLRSELNTYLARCDAHRAALSP